MNELNLIKKDLYEVKQLINYLSYEEEIDLQTLKDTKESIKVLFESKSDQIGFILKELEQKENQCKDYVDMFLEKKENLKKQKEKLKHIVMETMKDLDIKKIETETGSITIRKNAPAVIIENEDTIPNQFKTIIQTVKIEKTEIKNAIKNGEIIDGAYLKQSESLVIK